MSVAQATCSRMKREKVVALQALDWQSVWYWQQSIDSQGGGLNHFNLAEVSLVWLPWPLGTAPPYPTAWRHVDHGLLWWHTFSQTQEGIMSPVGGLECHDAWGGDHASVWWSKVALMKPRYLRQTSPDYTKADMWETLALPLQQQSATTALPETAWTRALRSGVNTFDGMLGGYAAQKPQAFCNEPSARRFARKMKALRKQRPRGSWMRPWPKNGPLGRSRRIALGSANRSFNRYSMRIPTFVLPPGMYFFRECEEEVLRSRLVVRGGLRHASKLRTDSPIWSTRPPNSAFLLVTSWIWPMVFRCQKIKSTSMQACYR